MGWLDKLTGRNNPDYQKALELRKKQIEEEGARVSAQMQKEFAAKRTANQEAARKAIDAKDREIDSLLSEMGISRDELKKQNKKE